MPKKDGGGSPFEKQLNALEKKFGALQEDRQPVDLEKYEKYETDPTGFCRDVLGLRLWSKQREVAEALVEHQKVAVPAGHGVGKSALAGGLALWGAVAYGALVVITSKTVRQTIEVTMGAVRELFHASNLPGQMFQSAFKLPGYERSRGIVALTTKDLGGLQGFHAPRTFFVLDEAAELPRWAFKGPEVVALGEEDLQLMAGNPTNTNSRFFEVCEGDSSAFTVVRISCFDHPNITGAEPEIPGGPSPSWVEERRKEWPEPIYRARVLGQFADHDASRLVDREWVDRAHQDHATVEAHREAHVTGDLPGRLRDGLDGPLYVGVDPSRFGSNLTAVVARRGPHVEWVATVRGRKGVQDQAREIGQALKDRGLSPRKDATNYVLQVDDTGLGVRELLESEGWPVNPVLPQQSAPRHAKDEVHDLRAFLAREVVRALEEGRLTLPDDELGQEIGRECLVLRGTLDESGRFKLPPKRSLASELGRDTLDFLDALTYSFPLGNRTATIGAASPSVYF